jgi:hypothetical protein
MKGRYHLYVKTDGKWEWVAGVEASDHRRAFQAAMLILRPQHYDKQIRLEQEESE